MSLLKVALPLAALAGALSLGCGYHLNTKGSNLPPHIQSIGVPPFANQTTRPELGQRLTEEVRNQLVARGKYRVTSDASGVDATLTGTVLSWSSRPMEIGQDGGAAQRVSVTLRASVKFEDRVENRVRWESDDYTFTSEYEVIGDPEQYFDTELGAVETVAEDFARALTSAILQGF
jgi:outer membrane lipopolysaccharide assembly protein LptE/RlpB